MMTTLRHTNLALYRRLLRQARPYSPHIMAIFLQRLGSWLLHTYTDEQLVLDCRAQLFHHVQRLSLSYHDAKGTPDAAYRIHYLGAYRAWMTLNQGDQIGKEIS
jgi:hypothetical protein